MTTIASNQWEINGVIDTSRAVIDNLNEIANASGCFLTWDATQGTWSVVINDAGSSTFSFTDANIIGSITVSGSGVTEMYNAVTIEFPHKDLRDTTDYIDLKTPTADRFPQELDNRLNIRTQLVNDPIQAQLIASRELKQSRLDKIIKFRTDFTANGLQAGDLIDITNAVYGYTAKVFRIIEIVENDNDDGSLTFEITALEYDADVYSTAGLEREFRSKKTGVVPKAQNTAITTSEQEAEFNLLNSGLLNPLAALAALRFLNGFGESFVSNNGAMLSATAGSQRVDNLPTQTVKDVNDYSPIYSETFTAPFTATYVCQFIFDQNTSAALGGRGAYGYDEADDFVAVLASISDEFGNPLVGDGSGGGGAFFWTDYAISFTVNLVAGRNYTMSLEYQIYTESSLGTPASFSVNWNIYTVG